jgi:DNA-binding PucR family transcriptional regulator
VAAFIDHRLNIKATAQFLHVHENTVRYRLSRFQELTGVCLEDLQSAFEVWWALQRSWLSDQA